MPLNMGFGFRATTEKILGETDESMSVGQISIQRQCLLKFRNALSRAVRKHLDDSPRSGGPKRGSVRGKAL